MDEHTISDTLQEPVEAGLQGGEESLNLHEKPHLEAHTENLNEVRKPSCNKILLTQLNGTGYCFNANDYMTIRKDYRITGSFIGTNHVKGYVRKSQKLPVEFNEYEMQLLLDENIAILVSKKEAFERGADKKTEEEILTKLEERILAQGYALNEKKIQETIKNINRVMEGKRKKLIQSGVPAKDIKLSEDQVIQEMRSSMKFDRNNAQLEIPNQCLYNHEAQVVSFQGKDTLGYEIFRDIWKRGNVYVTLGGNFGGNFLIYPGDPLVFHASHVVHVLQNPVIQPLHMISKCRLTVNVNKICILAYKNSENDIRYQTVHWEGSKDKLNIASCKLKNDRSSDEDSDG
ncbi:tRNA-splicing endonuclease subunit Sen34 [Condylostylus longicornis]|uniref:tRNA-splicing endonuclease subunit Sen34 n=1 Tax=Condylostylus longicornis TaxID=2530218 RepID=UPI00244E0A5E|nr:tRNA-splicing endonuclease subunit Sen34 [Condylostylus longicornis]